MSPRTRDASGWEKVLKETSGRCVRVTSWFLLCLQSQVCTCEQNIFFYYRVSQLVGAVQAAESEL